jgi:hypothetical protein
LAEIVRFLQFEPNRAQLPDQQSESSADEKPVPWFAGRLIRSQGRLTNRPAAPWTTRACEFEPLTKKYSVEKDPSGPPFTTATPETTSPPKRLPQSGSSPGPDFPHSGIADEKPFQAIEGIGANSEKWL